MYFLSNITKVNENNNMAMSLNEPYIQELHINFTVLRNSLLRRLCKCEANSLFMLLIKLRHLISISFTGKPPRGILKFTKYTRFNC